MNDCIFCKIARGEAPSHKIWEDDTFYAFLSIYPNTEALTLVIPKTHYGSDVFELPSDVRARLMDAAEQVVGMIKAAYPEVGRVGVVFEGFGVNHLHAKLYPLHGTAMPDWKPIEHEDPKFFTQYEGYISTHEGAGADNTELAKIAEKIRGGSNPSAAA